MKLFVRNAGLLGRAGFPRRVSRSQGLRLTPSARSGCLTLMVARSAWLCAAWVSALSTACGSAGGSGGAGGGGTGGGGAGGGDLDACAEQSIAPNGDGLEVVRCEKFFDTPPLVRLPNDGDGVFYGALDGDGAFVTRDGVTHPLVSSDGVTPIPCALDFDGTLPGCDDPAWAPLHKVGVRRLYTLYRATGALVDGGPTLAATAVTPMVTASADAIANLYDRPFEGTANLRLVPFPTEGLFKFDEAATARLRLDPIGRRAPEALAIGHEEGHPDQTTVAVEFVVTNMNVGVASADGTCLPSLSSYGEANPFHTGTVDELEMTRFANMHAPGDDHVVMAAIDPLETDTGISVALGGSMDIDDLSYRRVTGAPHLWLDPSLSLDENLVMSQMIHGTPNGFTLVLAPAGAAVEKDCP